MPDWVTQTQRSNGWRRPVRLTKLASSWHHFTSTASAQILAIPTSPAEWVYLTKLKYRSSSASYRARCDQAVNSAWARSERAHIPLYQPENLLVIRPVDQIRRVRHLEPIRIRKRRTLEIKCVGQHPHTHDQMRDPSPGSASIAAAVCGIRRILGKVRGVWRIQNVVCQFDLWNRRWSDLSQAWLRTRSGLESHRKN